MTIPAVHVTGVRYAFGEHVAVDGVDLTVHPGEIFGMLGPNGAGKTTTIRMITTLLPVRTGMVEVFGRNVRKQTMAVRRLVGYVPQALSADAALTGRENVALFARLFDVPRRQRKDRTAEVLDSMRLTDAADRAAGTYSGGMGMGKNDGPAKDWGMLGAIVATPGMPHFFKVTGPARTVRAARPELDELLSTLATR